MRAIILASVLPTALAFWNGEFCNGAGACVGIGVLNSNPFRCPDGSSITVPSFGLDLRAAGMPGAIPVSKEEFPKTCYQSGVPGPNARFVKTKTRNGQTAYSWITENCRESKPAAPGNCYNFNTNPSTYTFCQLVDSNGNQCTENPNAGRCERWGNTAGRTECEGWKVGQPDFPDN